MQRTRPAAVAGIFYPAGRNALQEMVETLLAENPAEAASNEIKKPCALVVPHAGLPYSGGMAAGAYNRLKPFATTIRRVVLLGPSHRVALRGMALPSQESFTTPLGTIPLDTALIEKLRELPDTGIQDAAHAQEHSLEVQLPFLQTILDNFLLVPVVVGDTTPESVARMLSLFLDKKSPLHEETLVIISSDLSHFLSYQKACAADQQTIDTILALQPILHGENACGCRPLNGLLLAARQHHLAVELIGYCNSGDTAGDKSRVVGYAAFSVH